MTSNVGATVASKQSVLGFGAVDVTTQLNHQEVKDKTIVEAKQHFKPELLNRLDDIIVFRTLEKSELKTIIDLEASKVLERIQEQGLHLTLDDTAKEFLIEKGYNTAYGARPIKRAVETYIENPMSEEILKETFKPGDKLIVKATKEITDALVFTVDKIKIKKNKK